MATSAVGVTAGALLGLLAEKPMTGWELVQEAKDRFGNFWAIQRSQAYRELGQLEAAGLIESLPAEARGRRRYRITDVGHEAYTEWVQRAPGADNVRLPFLLTVAFVDDIPRERFTELLEDQRRRHGERLRQYEELWEGLRAAGARGGRMATLALGIGYERAALAWLDDLPAILGDSSGTTGGAPPAPPP